MENGKKKCNVLREKMEGGNNIQRERGCSGKKNCLVHHQSNSVVVWRVNTSETGNGRRGWAESVRGMERITTKISCILLYGIERERERWRTKKTHSNWNVLHPETELTWKNPGPQSAPGFCGHPRRAARIPMPWRQVSGCRRT